jgi:hypothetical protein
VAVVEGDSALVESTGESTSSGDDVVVESVVTGLGSTVGATVGSAEILVRFGIHAKMFTAEKYRRAR